MGWTVIQRTEFLTPFSHLLLYASKIQKNVLIKIYPLIDKVRIISNAISVFKWPGDWKMIWVREEQITH